MAQPMKESKAVDNSTNGLYDEAGLAIDAMIT